MVLGPTIRKLLPYVNFVIATGALVFQMKVLYPWHKQLDEDFQKLKEDQNDKLVQFHKVKLDALTKIEEDVTEIKKQQSDIHVAIKENVTKRT